MAILCRRNIRATALVDFGLVLILVALVFIYINRNDIMTSSRKVNDYGEVVFNHEPKKSMTSLNRQLQNNTDGVFPPVDARVRIIEDARSKQCRRKSHVDTEPEVSLVLVFTDYEFYDVKNTFGSLLLFGNMNLIKEIIVVDDASTLEYIIEQSNNYFRLVPKLRLLRNRMKEPIGTAHARSMAVKEAAGEVLVFVDSSTIFNRGWLEPLLEQLRIDPKCFAVPHYDLIHDPVSLEYKKTPDNYVSSMTWSLAIRFREDFSKPSNVEDGTIQSPAIRGNVFAVRKEFFLSIGGYDDELFSLGGGEHIELSLRTWMCGGSIKIVTCSRVGILNLNDPVKVSVALNARQIADMWFGDKKSTVYRTLGIKFSDQSLQRSVSSRRETLGECKSIEWYLKNIATDLVSPRHNAVKFGVMKVKTDRCSRLLKSNKVKLDDCKPEQVSLHPPEFVFELIKDGRLMVMDKCLTVKENAYILAEGCRTGESKQKWMYRNEELINVWSRFCAMHVTDPDEETEGDRQIMMVQECNSDTSKGNLFKRWEFVTI